MKKKINIYSAQHRRQLIILFPLIWMIPIGVLIGIVLFGNLTESDTKMFIVIIVANILLSVTILFTALNSYFHKIIITEKKLILKDFIGRIVNSIEKEDITRIVYYAGFSRNSVPFLVIEYPISENIKSNPILNKKGEYIKLDFNLDKLNVIRQFYQYEIVNLPDKYMI